MATVLGKIVTAVCLQTPANADLIDSNWMLGSFVRPAEIHPLIKPNLGSVFQCPVRNVPVRWEALHTFNPAAIVFDGKVCVLYRAEDDSGSLRIGSYTSCLGLAESEDGIHFVRRASPVFFPDNDSQLENEMGGGCEDSRLIRTKDGLIVLTYTQWNRKIARLAIATTRDLIHWKKHGPAFINAFNGKYATMPCKSASIVGRLIDGNLTAVKINGRYWMYWGEGVSEDTLDDAR